MRHIFHGAVDVILKEVIRVNFLLPCWNASFQKDHMKNSIKSDIFLLNIYSLTNLSSFFLMENPSIKTALLASTFSSLKKLNPSSAWSGNQPLGAELHKRLCGAQGPPGESGRSRPLRHCCWYCAQSCSSVWGQQQGDLSFPEPQRVVLQHRGKNGVGERNMFASKLPPKYAETLLTDRSSHVTL